MSKDLRFNKEDFFFSDEEGISLLRVSRKATEDFKDNIKYRSKENHLRRFRKRISEVEYGFETSRSNI